MRKRLEARIVGRVQMVMFRDFTCRVARGFRLTGEVWNEPDGSVSVVAEGEAADLESFLAHLHRGPILAHVESVREQWGEETSAFTEFRIRYR